MKRVCEAASALILPALLDVGARLLRDFVALCDRGCCGEWKKWGGLLVLPLLFWMKTCFGPLSKPHSSSGNSLNATLQRTSRKSYINDTCVMWSSVLPCSLSIFYPFLLHTRISPFSIFLLDNFIVKGAISIKLNWTELNSSSPLSFPLLLHTAWVLSVIY